MANVKNYHFVEHPAGFPPGALAWFCRTFGILLKSAPLYR
jgi:hypothetical protein